MDRRRSCWGGLVAALWPLAVVLVLIPAVCLPADAADDQPAASPGKAASGEAAKAPEKAAEAQKPEAGEEAAKEADQPKEPQPPLPPGVVARVNGEEVARDRLIKTLVNRYGKPALDAMVQQMVILQKGRQLGLEVADAEIDEEFETFLKRGRFPPDMPQEKRREEWLKVLETRGLTEADFRNDVRVELLLRKIIEREVGVTDEEVAEEFERRHGEKLFVRQIVVDTKEEAERLRGQITDAASFEQLAEKHPGSRQTADSKGRIRMPVTRGSREKAFEDVVFALEVQGISQPLELDGKWYILKLDNKRDAPEVNADEARTAIRTDLAKRQEQRLRPQMLKDLMDQAKIQKADLRESEPK